ncbi:MAG: arsenate reductase ArsC [Acidimicrobiales bacterium]
MTNEYLDPATRRRVERDLDELRTEFRGIFGPETIERYLADSIDDLTGARIQTYLPIFIQRFARSRLRALAQVQGAIVKDRPIVLFLCTHNSGRSAAARVLLDHYAQGRVEVLSAGSEPGTAINPAVVKILNERGLDASKEFPKPITDEIARAADVIVTMGCGDACPVYPGKRYLDWDLTDPAGLPVDLVRPIVDDIDQRVQALLAELVPATA